MKRQVYICHSERSEESVIQASRPTTISAKSFHSGLIVSINTTFLARGHPLSCFSRAIAPRMALYPS